MQFSMRPIEETIEDIATQDQIYHEKKITSCFLQDGDALVVGYRIAGCNSREDSLRTVQEKCRNIRGKEILIHVSHTHKQMAEFHSCM